MTTGAQEPGTPPDEGARLMALARLAILDTPPDENFDRVTRLAARTLDAPIALISLVDQTRQWFKSSVGLQIHQTPREISFCGHAIYERKALVVPDATLDPRFATNPLVTGAPHVRAYAGIPLFTSDEQPIGTLCVMDTRPRTFDVQAVAALTDLAAIAQCAIHTLEIAKQNESVLQFAQTQEQLFRETFEQAGIGMVHVSLAGLVLRANRQACELLGYEREHLQLRSVIDLTHPDDLARAAMPFRRMVAGEIHDYRIQKRILTGSGEYLAARLTVVLRRNQSGQPDHLIGTIEQDVSAAWDTMARDLEFKTQQLAEQNDTARQTIRELIEAEARQREAERRYRTVADGVPALMGYWNRALRCEFANAMYGSWFGLSPESILGMHMNELLDEALYATTEPHARAALEGEPQQFERRLVKPDGTTTFFEARYVPDRDESGTVRGFFALVTDVTSQVNARLALESSNASLTRESGTDFLTGLANRRVFNEQAEDAAAAFLENGEPYGLILVDLDDFKRINDRFGHEVGDQVLREVGRILRDELRGREDLAARLGGEELAVLCVGRLDEMSLRQLAERIRAQINKQTVNTVRGLVRFTASFGVALCQPDDAGWKSTFERADLALYRAKESGKDRVAFGRSVMSGNTGRFKKMKLVGDDPTR